MKDTLRQLVRTLKGTVAPGGSLTSRTVKSGFWMTLLNVGDRGLQLLLLVVLASLLPPGDFGLLGIALLTLSALQQFTFLGTDEALIQRAEDDVDAYLNTAWVLQTARGLLMGGVVFLVAPYVASFFGEPRVTDVLRVIAVSPLLLGLKNPGIVYFRKHLEFHKQFVYSMSGSVTNFVVAVSLAFADFNVWALVFGYVAGDGMRLLSSYLVHPNRPRPGFDVGQAKELLNYGKWLTGSTIILFLLNEGDDVVVGWLLTASSLGLYQVAYRIAKAPATEITQVITRVTFPAFSKVQDDKAALREAFYRTIQLASFLGFPVGVGIIVVAPTFVEAFLGEPWMPMVPAMQLVAVYGLILTVTSSFGSVWKAVGRPDYLTKIGAVRLVVLAVVVFPLTNQFGITGTAAAVLLVYLFPTLPMDVYFAISAIEGNFSRLFRELSYPTAASLGMGGLVALVDWQLALGSPVLEFVVLVLTGVVGYAGTVAVLELGFDWGMGRNLRAIVTAIQS